MSAFPSRRFFFLALQGPLNAAYVHNQTEPFLDSLRQIFQAYRRLLRLLLFDEFHDGLTEFVCPPRTWPGPKKAREPRAVEGSQRLVN